MDDRVSIPDSIREVIFALHHGIQICSVNYTASYLMIIWCSFLSYKAAGA